MHLTVYTQPSCGPCRATLRAFERHGVTPDRIVDVQADPEAGAALRALGFTATPVVELDYGDERPPLLWQGFDVGYIRHAVDALARARAHACGVCLDHTPDECETARKDEEGAARG